jgi:hypothetical protein
MDLGINLPLCLCMDAKMEETQDRRYHQRLPLRLNVLCQTVGLSGGRSYSGSTVDVSTGGMLVEMNEPGLNEGQLISVEVSVPPTTGLMEYGGRLSSYARVCRIDQEQMEQIELSKAGSKAIALEFCDCPHFST